MEKIPQSITTLIVVLSFILYFSACDSNEVSPVATISNLTGFPDDIITITGTNFETDTSKVQIKFGSTNAKVIGFSTTEIKAKVPKFLSPGVYPVKVIMNSAEVTIVDYTIPTPEIISFSPNTGTDGTVMKISGKNFGSLSNTLVYFNFSNSNNLFINAESVSENEIVVKVPPSGDDYISKITAKFIDLNNYETNEAGDFTFANWFYFKQSSGRRGDEIRFVVYGGSAENTTFYFDGISSPGKWSVPVRLNEDEVGVDIPINVDLGKVNITATRNIGAKPFLQKDSEEFTVIE